MFELCLQLYVDEKNTPIEDTSIEWTETASPPIPVATLAISARDIDAVEARTAERLVDQLAFNPWYTTDQFRPLGNLNRARKQVYQASSGHRLSYRFHTDVPLRNRAIGAAVRAGFSGVNRFVPWHRLPLQLSLLNLDAFRHTLRRDNLIDVDIREAPPKAQPVPSPVHEDVRTTRTYDGTYNDLSDPEMGAAGQPFGRNLKPVSRPDLFDTLNPVTVSRELLYRELFIPARSLNILAAAWIQFQVHDWVNHARYPLGSGHDISVKLPPGTPLWRNRRDGPEESEMRFGDNIPLVRENAAAGSPPILFGNSASHWWDASEVYGPREEEARALREKVPQDGGFRDGAKLLLDNGYLPAGTKGVEVTGFTKAGGLASAPCTRSSRASTTSSATRSARNTRISVMNGSIRWRGSSSPRSSPRSTPWSGRRRSWPPKQSIWA